MKFPDISMTIRVTPNYSTGTHITPVLLVLKSTVIFNGNDFIMITS